MTKKEFIDFHKAYERGKISAFLHIKSICTMCIESHQEELSMKRIKEIVNLNRHLWAEPLPRKGKYKRGKGRG